jgi:regulator of replication initiation timing
MAVVVGEISSRVEAKPLHVIMLHDRHRLSARGSLLLSPTFVRSHKASSIRETDDFRDSVIKHTKKNNALSVEIRQLKENLLADYAKGEKIRKDVWPQYYTRKWGLNNLFKYDLRQGYRVNYTLQFDGAGIAVALLELLPHDQYDRRFRYRTS